MVIEIGTILEDSKNQIIWFKYKQQITQITKDNNIKNIKIGGYVMSKLQANLLTSGGIGAMLLIAQLPLIWNVGVIALTVTGLSIINKKN